MSPSGKAVVVSGPGARALELEVSGPEDRRAVVFHSGAPSSRRVSAPLVAPYGELDDLVDS